MIFITLFIPYDIEFKQYLFMGNQIKNMPCELCASKKHSMLSELSGAHICNISENKILISHKKFRYFTMEGTRPRGIFCINYGVLKVYKTASNGKEQIIHLAKEGDFLGYSSLLGEENYASTSMIIEDAKICFIPREFFLNTLFNNTPFFKGITKSLSHEIGVMEAKLTDANQKNISERLAYMLLQFVSTFGVEGNENQKIDLVLRRDEIAGLVGTATNL
jgi:CRP/FNR family transcriptional regulator